MGATRETSIQRREFCRVDEVIKVVGDYLDKVRVRVDYLTFVGDGEPTLYSEIGKTARALSAQGWGKTALLSNASLVWRKDVLKDVLEFDFVSMKLDVGTESLFLRVNRPDPALRLSTIIEGLRNLSREIPSVLAIETMIVKDLNDGVWCADFLAEALRLIEPDIVYINTPIRPPAEKWVSIPSMDRLKLFVERLEKYIGKGKVVLLPLGEVDELLESLEAVEQVIEVAKLHPLPLDLVLKILSEKIGIELARKRLLELAKEGRIFIVKYRGKEYIKAR